MQRQTAVYFLSISHIRLFIIYKQNRKTHDLGEKPLHHTGFSPYHLCEERIRFEGGCEYSEIDE